MTIRSYKGRAPIIGNDVYIDESATVIGDVTLGNNVSIWPNAVVRGDVHKITIGDNTNIQDGAICHVTHDGHYNPGGFPLIIGKNVTIGHRAVLHGCEIQDNVLIGIGAILMDNVLIPSHTMIGAGALVPPDVELESGFIWVGTPVKQLRVLTDDEISFLAYSADHYIKVKNNYLTQELE